MAQISIIRRRWPSNSTVQPKNVRHTLNLSVFQIFTSRNINRLKMLDIRSDCTVLQTFTSMNILRPELLDEIQSRFGGPIVDIKKFA
jgi:hypothetical protein